MIALIIAVVAFIAMVYFISEFVKDYAKYEGTWWERALSASQESATILWSKFVALLGMGAGSLVSLSDYLNDPALTAAIKAALKPEYLVPFGIAVAVITIYVRKRTLPPKG